MATRMRMTGSADADSQGDQSAPRSRARTMASTLDTRWLPSLAIPDVLSTVLAAEANAKYVLVTVIDSTPQVRQLPSIVPLLDQLGMFYRAVDDDVVIKAADLSALVNRHHILSGFDEIWLCRDIPRAGKPVTFQITSDVPFGNDPPAGLLNWMLASTCTVGLGDGDGLNLATTEQTVAVALGRVSTDVHGPT